MSSKFESINKIKIVETNGEENPSIGSKSVHMNIKQHHTFESYVVIEIGGENYTVIADHLIKSIENCKNTH